jgi:hypothetical protein
MPTLLKEDLNKILELSKSNKEDYPYFIETGTYMGETILRFVDDFEKVFTIELSYELYNEFNKKEYNRDKLKSILGDSSIMIGEVIDELLGNSIFFLDGHYSSCNTARGDKDVPLNEELKIINDNFKYESLIIIDDLRLFGTNNAEDWSSISIDNLLKIVSERLETHLVLNDRLILKIKKI